MGAIPSMTYEALGDASPERESATKNMELPSPKAPKYPQDHNPDPKDPARNRIHKDKGRRRKGTVDSMALEVIGSEPNGVLGNFPRDVGPDTASHARSVRRATERADRFRGAIRHLVRIRRRDFENISRGIDRKASSRRMLDRSEARMAADIR